MTCKPVKERLPNLASTLRRQSTPGNAVLLVIAAIMFMPWLLDRYRDEPKIHGSLTFEDSSLQRSQAILVETNVAYTNSGNRMVVTYDENNKIVCMRSWSNVWNKPTKNLWDFQAFTGCDVPNFPFRVCTTFAIESMSGIKRFFGEGQEFCTEMVNPMAENEEGNTL